MDTGVAEGYEAMAIELEQHIKFYQPVGYREQIHVFDFTPNIIPSVAEECHRSYKEGSLKERLKKPFDYEGYDRGFKWYVQEAILDFFQNGIHQNYEVDSDE